MSPYSIKAYWYRSGRGGANFGDRLTPLLLHHFGIRCEWAPPERAELIGIGSVLEKVPQDFRGLIWSSGFIHENSRAHFLNAQVLGLRGKLTQERSEINSVTPPLLGDAGLLCEEFYVSRPKRYELGVIPHYVDADDPFVQQLAGSSRDITIVNICDEPREVIRAVSECKHVISSSLHGLILADSLNIPNCWLELNHGRQHVAGQGFKYRDYYSVFDLEPKPLHLTMDTTLGDVLSLMAGYTRPGITEVKTGLRKSVEKIRSQLRPLTDGELDARRAAEVEWLCRLDELKRCVEQTIPAGASVVVIDNDELRHQLDTICSIPFLERDDMYWGPPGSDGQAIGELTRQLNQGVRWVVLAWPMFWLLERFPAFKRALTDQIECVAQTPAGMIFRAGSANRGALAPRA
jgi:pyruvyltransferase